LRGLSKLFRAPIYWAHRAVVFAIARLSCLHYLTLQSILGDLGKHHQTCMHSLFQSTFNLQQIQAPKSVLFTLATIGNGRKQN